MANADETAVATSRELAITSPEQALREILGVISQSRDDETPVFDVILRNATELCGADSASIVLGAEGDAAQRMVAQRGVNPGTVARYDSGAYTMDRDQSLAAEAILDGRTIHVPDMAATEKYLKGDENFRSVVDDTGIRTNLFVPLMAAGGGIGALILFRKDVRPYSEGEIALVEAFAAQAVIAIENVRQFRDLQNRLEREAATSEVLGVISSSKDDESPVFDVILQNAARLCRAKVARLSVVNEKRNALKFAAQVGMVSEGMVPGVTEWPLDGTQGIAVAVRSGEIQHIPDYVDTDLYREGDPTRVMLVERDGLRSALVVPLLAAGGPIGVIAMHRETPGPFSDDEVRLVRTFAAQAVIAIENVRQFRELQARLERERASREVLDVISTSRENDIPVFETILRNASRICNAPIAFLSLADENRTEVRIPAHRGTRSKFGGILEGFVEPITRTELVAVRPVATGETVLEDDIKDDEAYRTGDPRRRQMVDVEGARSVLAVPLLKDGEPIGAIVLYKREVAPFSEDDLTLVQNFAAQAVIAIENVRQFREVQTRLERERASAEILNVISRSRDDELPVFEAVLRNAARLCDAPFADLDLVSDDGEELREVATWGAEKRIVPSDQWVWPMDGDFYNVETIREGRAAQYVNLKESRRYREGNPMTRAMVDEEGIRILLIVPLRRDGGAIGCIIMIRKEEKPFSEDEIALVETFAAQAVIAIENVRQFREVQERLERERASAEILEIISQSRDDEQPVFNAILERTAHLCQTDLATFNLMNDEGTHLEYAAHFGRTLHTYEVGVDRWPLDSTLQIAESVREGRIVHNIDLRETQTYKDGDKWRRQLADDEGVRSFLTVPLIAAEGKPIGCIGIYRKEVRAFSDDEIAMVETFAAQAVIAIENVRQFRELQERLERERASAEILDVISRSRDDDQPVFDVIVETVSRLCDAPLAYLCVLNEARSHVTIPALAGARPEFAAALNRFNEPVENDFLFAVKSSLDCEVIRFDDLAETDLYKSGNVYRVKMVDEEGMRSVLCVPLESDGVGYGCIVLYRREVAPFSDEDVKLVRGFAAQAVIAIQNVRQFKALETLNAELGDRVQEQVGEIERMGRLKRFLPSQVADAVVSKGDDILSSHRALIATLFCDIRGFTAFCERAEPEETIEVLQTYHEEMGRLLSEYGAGVEHRMGDGIMAIFNDPLPCEDPAGDALRLGLAMRDRMKELCKGWKRLGHRLGFGVGISLGYATVGMVGSEGRYEYTASGSAVNLAARLCDHAEDGEILLSPRAVTAVEDDFMIEPHGELSLKGIQEPVPVHRAVSAKS